MPIYHTLGKLPRKRHTQFRKEDGGLYSEHLMGNEGFTGIASLLYHLRPPTVMRSASVIREIKWEADKDTSLRPRHFRTAGVKPGGSPTLDRTPLMFNSDLAISLAVPTKNDEFFYRNSQGDELVYVARGEGLLETVFGELPYRSGDYLVIPRGITHRYQLGDGESRLLVFESAGYIRTPKRYRNKHGQLMEHSPYCERDIRRPEKLQTRDEQGDFPIVIKRDNRLHEVVLEHHPFDVVGWDGYFYPWALNIEDFEPIVGRLHQPPPVHQTFEGDGFVVCSFVPRLYDFHPDAVPVPYNHSNIMSEEMIYYASDEFMSRKGIEFGSITLHPDGVPHGPHPGAVEKSLGKKSTSELAVMADSFRPLQVAKQAVAHEDVDYHLSWLE